MYSICWVKLPLALTWSLDPLSCVTVLVRDPFEHSPPTDNEKNIHSLTLIPLSVTNSHLHGFVLTLTSSHWNRKTVVVFLLPGCTDIVSRDLNTPVSSTAFSSKMSLRAMDSSSSWKKQKKPHSSMIFFINIKKLSNVNMDCNILCCELFRDNLWESTPVGLVLFTLVSVSLSSRLTPRTSSSMFWPHTRPIPSSSFRRSTQSATLLNSFPSRSQVNKCYGTVAFKKKTL